MFASSGAVTGASATAIDEDEPPAPSNLYAVSKYASELVVAQYRSVLRAHSLRYFFIYGPGQQGMMMPGIIAADHAAVRRSSSPARTASRSIRSTSTTPRAPPRPRWISTRARRSMSPDRRPSRSARSPSIIGDEVGKAPTFENVARATGLHRVDRADERACWEPPPPHPARVWRGWSRHAEAGAVRQHFVRLGKQTLVYGLGAVAQQILGVITLPIYARVFAPSEYGVIEVLTVGLAVLAIVVDLGLNSAAQRSYFDYTDDDFEKRRVVLSTSIGSSMSIALLLAAGVAAASQPISVWLFGSDRYATTVVLAAACVPAGTLAALAARGHATAVSAVALPHDFADLWRHRHGAGAYGRARLRMGRQRCVCGDAGR